MQLWSVSGCAWWQEGMSAAGGPTDESSCGIWWQNAIPAAAMLCMGSHRVMTTISIRAISKAFPRKSSRLLKDLTIRQRGLPASSIPISNLPGGDQDLCPGQCGSGEQPGAHRAEQQLRWGGVPAPDRRAAPNAASTPFAQGAQTLSPAAYARRHLARFFKIIRTFRAMVSSL